MMTVYEKHQAEGGQCSNPEAVTTCEFYDDSWSGNTVRRTRESILLQPHRGSKVLITTNFRSSAAIAMHARRKKRHHTEGGFEWGKR